MKKKTIALVLACILCVGIGIGGTLAWLTDTTDAVTNTFTTSDINITLTESASALDDGDNDTKTNSYQMVPGYTITKDPKVTVTAGSEDCWLFVKLEKSANFDTYMEFTVDSGWTPGTGNGGNGNGVPVGVYFRKIIGATGKDTPLSILTNNQVTVKGTVTKALMKDAETNQPTLKVTAYASQLYQSADVEFPVATAWTNAQSTT